MDPALGVRRRRRWCRMAPRAAPARELADTWTLEIGTEAQALLGFQPGQFNMLYALGVGEVAISISGDPAGDSHSSTRSATSARFGALARLRPGGLARRARALRQQLAGRGGGRPRRLVVAGGLGLAPLRPALYRLLAERRRFGRVALLYGTRSPADILYPRELERWRKRLDLQLEVTVDHAGADWHGHVGVVTETDRSAPTSTRRTRSRWCADPRS